MLNFKDVLGEAAGGALCWLLGSYGAATPRLTAIALAEPTPVGETLAVGAGIAGIAAAFGCNWDPNGDGPEGIAHIGGCKKVKTGGLMDINASFNGDGVYDSSFGTGIEIIAVTQRDPGTGFLTWFVEWYNASGTYQSTYSLRVNQYPNYRVDGVIRSGECDEPAPIPPPPQPPTYTHTDTASGCELNVDFRGWALNTAGNVNGVWEISPALPPTRASGGIVGGCNFQPVIYIDDGGSGGDDGGGRYFTIPDPIPPDGEEPWWAPFVRGLAQGLAEAATFSALEEFFATRYPGGNYELKGVCELDPDGNPMDVTRSINFPDAKSPEAILYRLDALADMFQFAKDLRQPTCRESGQPITGDPVTINFESDTYTTTGKNVARKRFVYFDQVNSTLEDTVNHWRDFTWQAGPLIVNCFDTKLGKPQIWAASLAEAQRVFAHAAAIAGVDLTGARYETATPKSSRYGFTGLMRVAKDGGGTFGITKRDGPSGLPPGLG